MAATYIKKLPPPEEQKRFLREHEREADMSYQPPSINTTEADVAQIHFVYPDTPPKAFRISGPTSHTSKYRGRVFETQEEALAWARRNYDWARPVRMRTRGTWLLEVSGWHGRGDGEDRA